MLFTFINSLREFGRHFPALGYLDQDHATHRMECSMFIKIIVTMEKKRKAALSIFKSEPRIFSCNQTARNDYS